jgi:uncharacterized protein GlcG (DUF336 family)
MPDTTITHRLTDGAYWKMLQAGVAKARQLGVPVGVGVVDAGGILRGWVLMDGAPPIAAETVLRKARTSAYIGAPTGGLPDDIGTKLALAVPDFTNLAGGFPILKDGAAIGGIAAGGGSHEQDVEIAEAALAAVDLS